MSSRVCATGHIKDPVQLIEKSRALCPRASCHKVVLWRTYKDYVLPPKMALDADRTG